jgi:perosamine synthetase
VKKFYPVNIPKVNKSDIANVTKVMKSGWISSDGPELKSFEAKFSKFIKKKHSIAVSNGTAALEVAMKAIGIGPGDEVIIPNFTIISNALAVIKLGATPILVDCGIYDWNINIESLKKKITTKTKAVVITHIYSFSNPMDKIIKILKKKKLIIIEDAAEVVGLSYKNKMCGSFGDISTFSFYANKHITTGEGGMICTNNKAYALKCRDLRNLCFGKTDRFNHTDIGWNYRFTNIQAAIGLSQLKNINKIIKKKILIGKTYYHLLSKNKHIFMQAPQIKNSKNIYWVVGILILNKKISAKELSLKLLEKGIQTRPFFYPMNKQKILSSFVKKDKDKYPNSEHISKYGFYLPSYFDLTNKDIKFICNELNVLLS